MVPEYLPSFLAWLWEGLEGVLSKMIVTLDFFSKDTVCPRLNGCLCGLAGSRIIRAPPSPSKGA